MKKKIPYLFVISLVLVLLGWYFDSDKVKPTVLAQMIEIIAMIIIVFSIFSGFTWVIMKLKKSNCINNFRKTS